MVSLLGIAVLLGIAFALSSAKRNINWRTVGGAFAIQASVGAFVLYSEPGKEVLLSATRFVANIIAYSQEGINFLFGPIGDKSIAFIFAFNVLPVIVFFSALIAVLYHLKVMGLIIKVIGGFLQKALGTSRPESMSSAANIFVGQTEAPLVVRPFIPHMTSSELFAIMVGGLASIAGSVMAGYAGMGVDLKYLLAASFMAAPGGLLMAKIMLPETSKPMMRDLKERGRSIESVAKQYEETVKPMYHQFIEPSRFTADVVVTQGGKNQIALDVIKSHIQQALL